MAELGEIAAGEGQTPLAEFRKLVFDAAKARNLLPFRLAHNPSIMIFHRKGCDHLSRSRRPESRSRLPEGWGITTFELSSREPPGPAE